jgi:hypothetical protein
MSKLEKRSIWMVRTPRHYRRAVEVAARADNRNLNQMAATLIAEGLRNRGIDPDRVAV